MDNLLKRQPVSISRYVIRRREECAVDGEFTLPDYCPDIAMILKCILSPCVQNRQWSGDQLLVDVAVNVRVLYLDEERCAVRSVEFTVPTSCALRTEGQVEMTPVSLRLKSKYANCRAVSPRRLEVRGAVQVEACAEMAVEKEMALAEAHKGLYTQCNTMEVTCPGVMTEKVLTISEALEFPETLPPAEMLLGGDCRAVVRECKLLTGKAIVKGQIFLHQLYTDDVKKGSTRCLDFVLPFSQILDIEGAEEGIPYWADVQVLSDVERCTVGPDGENTLLDVTVKLLVQMQIYTQQSMEILLDAYHTDCPVTVHTEDVQLRTYKGCRWENTVLPMQFPLGTGQLREIVDVWISWQDCDTICENGIAVLTGRLHVCLLARDADGQIIYLEQPEDYRLEYACSGNSAYATVTVTELRYRMIEDKLELQIGLCVGLCMAQETLCRAVQDVQLHQDASYPPQRVAALLYYAEPGEKVWDIGRKCRTSPVCICEENGITGDAITQTMVLTIPIVS